MALSDEQRAALAADSAGIIARYPRSRSALLPLLHLVQAEEGYISADGIAFCAAQLGLAEAEVTAVVSFYTMFKRRPVGQYHVGVCTNALCAVMGGDAILADLREHLSIGDDEMMVNWEFFDDMTPQRARDLVDDLRAGADVAPSRGAPRLCTWRQASRILAGFPDGQAAEGHTAGHASLAGLRIAKEHGWAPDGGQS